MGGGEQFKTFVGAAAINTSEHCSANMPTLTLAKSQTVLNFSNYTLIQLTGVISALTLCFTQAVVPWNLRWLFYRLLRNVAIDISGGKPGPNKKTTKKTKNSETNAAELGRVSGLYRSLRNT